MDKETKRAQVSAQCRAVAHMAKSLADVSLAMAYHVDDRILDTVGKQTAHQMEVLGNILNGMDAVTDEDDWITPIMIVAQRTWPTNDFQ